MINVYGFQGEYRFLSNFWTCEILGPGDLTYRSVEHAYQAWKFEQNVIWDHIRTLTPGAAKRYANKRKTLIRKDWDSIKLQVMENLLRQKFLSGSELSNRLAAIDGDIIEVNNWGDKFWGMVKYVGNDPLGRFDGQNQLGKLLMKIRDEKRYSTDRKDM